MKFYCTLAIALIVTSAAQAQNSVNGYWRKNGTFVAPHFRTNPDSSRLNNWSTQGNSNPYTGRRGTVDPYARPSFGGFGQNYVGPRRRRRWQ